MNLKEGGVRCLITLDNLELLRRDLSRDKAGVDEVSIRKLGEGLNVKVGLQQFESMSKICKWETRGQAETQQQKKSCD
jgi:hypothetical protein